jgi:CBS domain-containing protein
MATTTLRDVMTQHPIALSGGATVVEAARQMRLCDVGAVLVDDGLQRTFGILTDRDIAVRVVAEALDPLTTKVGDVCTRAPIVMSQDEDIRRAVKTMRDHAIRRIVVVDDDQRAVGIVSLGDLAIERDGWSALAQISAAPPNQ